MIRPTCFQPCQPTGRRRGKDILPRPLSNRPRPTRSRASQLLRSLKVRMVLWRTAGKNLRQSRKAGVSIFLFFLNGLRTNDLGFVAGQKFAFSFGAEPNMIKKGRVAFFAFL